MKKINADKLIFGSVAVAFVGACIGIPILTLYNRAEYKKNLPESNKPIVATVIEESYENTLVPVPKEVGLFTVSNETVTIESKYTLKVTTKDGRKLGVAIKDCTAKTKESLDALIEPGTRISFPQGNVYADREYASGVETSFADGENIGTKCVDSIAILGEK